MKKLLLGLGAIASVAAPVAAVVACGSTTEDASVIHVKKADLTENFTANNTDLADATEQLAGELLEVSKKGNADTEIVGVGGLKVLKFNVDGIKGSFDFLNDHFLQNGISKESNLDKIKADAPKIAKANVDTIINALKGKFGPQDDYVKAVGPTTAPASEVLAIDSTKGLVINPLYLEAFTKNEDAVKEAIKNAPKNAHGDYDLNDATIVSAQKVVDKEVSKIEEKLRFVLRMAIGAKTSLHVGFDSQGWYRSWTFDDTYLTK